MKVSYGDEFRAYQKVDGLPKVGGKYWHRFEKPRSDEPPYSILSWVEIHPEGYPFCAGGRMDTGMPGDWYGPVEA